MDSSWLWQMKIRSLSKSKLKERLTLIHDAQLLSYLRVCGKSVGLIINFPVRLLKK